MLDLQPEDGINGPDDFLGRYGAAVLFATSDAAPAADTFDVIFRLNRRHAGVREAGMTTVVTNDEQIAEEFWLRGRDLNPTKVVF